MRQGLKAPQPGFSAGALQDAACPSLLRKIFRAAQWRRLHEIE
jgi:hypothetical protein